jgi:hypothetical protein
MNSSCVDPKCHYSEHYKKCIKPNSYIEAIAWCKRNNIDHKVCKENFNLNKKDAAINNCDRYRERLQFNLDKLNKVKRVKKVKEIKEKKQKKNIKKEDKILTPVNIQQRSQKILTPINQQPQKDLTPVNIQQSQKILTPINQQSQKDLTPVNIQTSNRIVSSNTTLSPFKQQTPIVNQPPKVPTVSSNTTLSPFSQRPKTTPSLLGTNKVNSNINRDKTKSEPILNANSKCVSPKCVYSEYRKKCVKPNPFIESNSRCVKTGDKNTCIDSYNNNKLSASNNACSYYEERIHSKKSNKSSQKIQNNNNILKQSIKKQRKILIKPNNQNLNKSNFKTIANDNIFNRKNKGSLLKIPNDKILKMKQAKIIKSNKKSNKKQEPIKSKNNLMKDLTLSASRQRKLDSFIKRRVIKSAARKIQRVLKPFANRTSANIFDRIRYTDLIRKYLSTLRSKQCIIPLKDSNGNYNNQYGIGDKIILPKQIGTKSAYGIIYKSKGKNKGELFRFATKLMKITQANYYEIKITDELSNLVLTNKNPHFPITYKTFECIAPIDEAIYPELIRKNKYYVFLNELANGDLKMYLHSTALHDANIIKNTIVQMVLAIYSFHIYTKHKHDDCHWGNFLYHKVNKGGYIHYNINNKDYYLENLGYLWIIWDYGLMKPLKKNSDFYNDYLRGMVMCINESKKGALENHHVIPQYANDFIFNIIKELYNNNNNERNFIKSILNKKILNLLEKNDLPANAKIINSTPYVL